MKNQKASKVKFFNDLPAKPKNREQILLIYDKVLAKTFGPWINDFPNKYAVKSGESLKDLRKFPLHISKILKLVEGIPRSELKVFALGGGSVGDFSGFVASVLYRGVGFVQIPTTWLAAVDSAHGGKTALNVDHFKNQIGTFFPAQEIWISKKFLLTQPDERAKEAFGEVVKIGLLEGGQFWDQILKMRAEGEAIWAILPKAVHAKWKVVLKDPQELKGQRLILNLGHTLGHVFESRLGLPHGKAVAMGLQFALNWSKKRGDLPGKVLKQLVRWQKEQVWPSDVEVGQALSRIKKPEVALRKDKKKSAKDHVKFVFSKGPGIPLIKDVSIQDILKEIQRQIQGKNNKQVRRS